MKERKFERTYSIELMRLAEQDLKSGVALLSAGVRIENACFHFHQAVEKTIKAVLIDRELSIPLLHDLGVLIGRVPPSEGPIPGDEDLLSLNVYSAVRRYEEGPSPATTEDGEFAKKAAEKVYHWGFKKLGLTKVDG